MRASRFTEEQIIGILKRAEAGMKTADLCREQGISEGTFYKWKAKYGGLEVNEARRLKRERSGAFDSVTSSRVGIGGPGLAPWRLSGRSRPCSPRWWRPAQVDGRISSDSDYRYRSAPCCRRIDAISAC